MLHLFSATQFKTCLFILFISILTSSCSTLISATRQNPIEENYGKRTAGATVDDEFIETKAEVNIKKAGERFRPAQIKVTSYNGVVLLTGNVPEAGMREEVTNIVQRIRKVRRVHNELNVNPPREFSARVSDDWLSKKVKSKLLFNKNIESSRVKVVANNGVIYLMGLMTRNEADFVVSHVKDTYGLQKIVRVFEYIEK